MVISVGYRIKSERGVQFRRWATNVLRRHLVQGYTLNRARFEKNTVELEQVLALICKAAHAPTLTAEAGSGLLDDQKAYFLAMVR